MGTHTYTKSSSSLQFIEFSIVVSFHGSQKHKSQVLPSPSDWVKNASVRSWGPCPTLRGYWLPAAKQQECPVIVWALCHRFLRWLSVKSCVLQDLRGAPKAFPTGATGCLLVWVLTFCVQHGELCKIPHMLHSQATFSQQRKEWLRHTRGA